MKTPTSAVGRPPRWLVVALGLSLGLNVAALVAGLRVQQPRGPSAHERYELVSRAGEPMGWYGATPTGAELVFTFGTSTPWLRVAAEGDVASITFRDAAGDVTSALVVDADATHMSVREGTARVELTAGAHGATLDVTSGGTAVAVSATDTAATVSCASAPGAEASGVARIELTANQAGARVETRQGTRRVRLETGAREAALTVASGEAELRLSAADESASFIAKTAKGRLELGADDTGGRITTRDGDGVLRQWPEAAP